MAERCPDQRHDVSEPFGERRKARHLAAVEGLGRVANQREHDRAAECRRDGPGYECGRVRELQCAIARVRGLGTGRHSEQRSRRVVPAEADLLPENVRVVEQDVCGAETALRITQQCPRCRALNGPEGRVHIWHQGAGHERVKPLLTIG